MWESIFDSMMTRLIRTGELSVTYPDGKTRRYGKGDGVSAAVTIKDNATLRHLVLNPEMGLGEGYMDGRLTVENDDIMGVLRLALRNRRPDAFPAWVNMADRLRAAAKGFIQRNTALTARQNVAHHYDISDDLYRLFLDPDMQYSCAYFVRPDMSLAEAQEAKKAHIAAKLMIRPDDHVLDIGSGWGGMALTLARDYGARVTGVTLSKNQLATAQARAEAEGLSDRVTFRLLDYRKLNETFDRIVSVGMLEHVGVPQYDTYFNKVSKLLKPDGISLIHTIGRTAPPTSHSPWIHKYIFPGGYVPSLSELAPSIERSGLWQTDIEVWRLHYAFTLRKWLENFDAHLGEVRKMYDERFIRMWRYYLIACIAAFEEQEQGVYQFQLAHKRDAVPLTRDYLYEKPVRIRAQAAE